MVGIKSPPNSPVLKIGTTPSTQPSPLFLQAGHAIFTVSNPTGDHYTYRIQTPDVDEDTPEDRRKPIWFVGLLTGPENTADYKYLGVYDPQTGTVRLTKASKLAHDSKPFRVLMWALQIIHSGKQLPPGYTITRSTRCGRCGRELTRPEGTDETGYRFGFGPVCWAKLQGE